MTTTDASDATIGFIDHLLGRNAQSDSVVTPSIVPEQRSVRCRLAGSGRQMLRPLQGALPRLPPRLARLARPPLPASPAPRPARLPALSAHLPASPPAGEGVLRIRGRLVKPHLRLLLRLVVPPGGPEPVRPDPLSAAPLPPPFPRT